MPDPCHRKDDDSVLVFGEPARRRQRGCRGRGSDKTGFGFGPTVCLTLEDDEISRCGRPVSKRSPRCRVHQKQYRTIYLKYKSASERAKDLQQTDRIPSTHEIEGYQDLGVILRKIEHVDKYLKLVQIEKIGRDIHGRRFFLERDYLHLKRIDSLEEEVKRSSEVFLALKGRANSLCAERFYRRQGDSSPSDSISMDHSGSLGDDTSGTTLRKDQASRSEFAKRLIEWLTNDPAAANLKDVDDDLIQLECVIPNHCLFVSQILTLGPPPSFTYNFDWQLRAMVSADLLYASVDYFFSK